MPPQKAVLPSCKTWAGQELGEGDLMRFNKNRCRSFTGGRTTRTAVQLGGFAAGTSSAEKDPGVPNDQQLTNGPPTIDHETVVCPCGRKTNGTRAALPRVWPADEGASPPLWSVLRRSQLEHWRSAGLPSSEQAGNGLESPAEGCREARGWSTS